MNCHRERKSILHQRNYSRLTLYELEYYLHFKQKNTIRMSYN